MGPPAYAFPPLFRQNGPYPRQSDSFYSIQGQLITFRCNTRATLKQSNFKRKNHWSPMVVTQVSSGHWVLALCSQQCT